jgi:mannosyltransferase OCH1-like enzyme
MTLPGEDPTGLTEIQKIYEQSQVPLQWLGQIPNRVFQTSIGRLVGPTDSARLRSQRLRYAQHNFYLFDEARVEAYMLQHWSHRRIFEVFHSARFSAVKADIWRYCVLYHYGGIYVDMNSDLGFDPDSIDPQARELVSFEDRALEETLKN